MSTAWYLHAMLNLAPWFEWIMYPLRHGVAILPY